MQVQRSTRSALGRSRALFVAVALVGIPAGCAHEQAETESPDAALESELAQLRRENAALRAQVQNLEERVRIADSEDAGWGSPDAGISVSGEDWADEGVTATPTDEEIWGPADELDGPRKLPVVKLTPKGRSIEHREPAPAPAEAPREPARRGNASITLSPAPDSGGPQPDETYVDARGAGGYADPGYDEGGLQPNYVEPGADAGEPQSYRLVGSKLVKATQSSASRSRPQARERGGKVLRDYKSAMAIYRDGRYADAEDAFAAIVKGHPDHDYADNALYWQGEAAYDQAHYSDALAAFTAVVERYGGGNKAPDALLKIGLCYGRLGDKANARDVLTQLIAAYPRAPASKIAKRKLADLD